MIWDRVWVELQTFQPISAAELRVLLLCNDDRALDRVHRAVAAGFAYAHALATLEHGLRAEQRARAQDGAG